MMNVHLVFGESTAGAIKWMLSKVKRQYSLIGFPDFFAIGPIHELENEKGLVGRVQWFKDNMAKGDMEAYYTNEYEAAFRQGLQDICDIPTDARITIWKAENAPEQIGLRFVLKLLEGRENNIHVINASESFNKYCKPPDIFYSSLHSSEISPENLKVILEKTNSYEPISREYKTQLIREWEALTVSEEVLRLWEDNAITSVSVDHLDSFIINSARRLEWKYGEEFRECSRLVGDVIVHIEQYVGDAFIFNRILYMIEQGIFEYEGTLSKMRNFKVRLAKERILR